MVHEWNLLPWLVRYVEIALHIFQHTDFAVCERLTLSIMKSNRSMKRVFPPCSSTSLAVSCGTYYTLLPPREDALIGDREYMFH